MNIIKQIIDENGNNIYPIGYAQGGMKMDLLWTNPSPTSDFASQTVSLDLTDYSYLFIVQRQYKDSSGNSSTALLPIDGVTYVVVVISDGGETRTRTYSASASSVTVGVGKSGSTINNAYAIPYQIYGIKMSYIVPTSVHGLQYVEV